MVNMTYQSDYKKFIFFLILTLFTFSSTNLKANTNDATSLWILWGEVNDSRPIDKEKNLIERRDFFMEELSRLHSKKTNQDDFNLDELSILMEIYLTQSTITLDNRKIDPLFYQKYKFTEKYFEKIFRDEPLTLSRLYWIIAIDHLYPHNDAIKKFRLLSEKHRFYVKKGTVYFEKYLKNNNISNYEDFFKITEKRNIELIQKEFNDYAFSKHFFLSSLIRDNKDKKLILEHIDDLYKFYNAINIETVENTNFNLKDYIFTEIELVNVYYPYLELSSDHTNNFNRLSKTCFDEGLKPQATFGMRSCNYLADKLFDYYLRNSQYDKSFEIFQSYISLNTNYDHIERNLIGMALKSFNSNNLNQTNFMKFQKMRKDLVTNLYLTSVNSGGRDSYLIYALRELYLYDQIEIANTKHETIAIGDKLQEKNLEKLYEAINIAKELGLSSDDHMMIGLNMELLYALSNYSIKKNNINEIYKIIKIVEQKNLHQDSSLWSKANQTNFFELYYALLGRLTTELANDGRMQEAKRVLEKFKNYKNYYSHDHFFTTNENYCYAKNDIKCMINNELESIETLLDLINEKNNQSLYTQVARGYGDLSRLYWKDNDFENFLITTYEGYQAIEKTLNLGSSVYLYGMLNQREFLNSLKTFQYDQSLRGLIQAAHINNYKNLKKYDVGIEVEIIDSEHKDYDKKLVQINHPNAPYILSKRTVKVISVKEKSPASFAGIKKGDYIIEIDGYDFHSIRLNDIDFWSYLDKYIMYYIESKPNLELLVVRENTQLNLTNSYSSELIKINNIDLITEKGKGAIAYKYSNSAFKATQLLAYSKVSQTYSNLYNRMKLQNSELAILLKEYELIINEIKKLQQKQIDQKNKDLTFIDKNFTQIQQKKNMLQEINKQIDYISPNIERAMNIKLYELDQIQNLLGKNDSIIIPFNADGSHYTWFISNSVVHLFKPLPSNLRQDQGFQSNVENIIQGINKKVNGTIEPWEESYYIKQSTENLYDMLIRQLQENDYLKDIKKITFITNEELSKIPLSILKDSDTKKYLIDKFAITNVINLSAFEAKSISLNYDTYQTFLGIGNPIFDNTKTIANEFPKMDRKNFLNTIFRSNQLANIDTLRALEALPETEDELKRISSNFKNKNTKLLLKEDASEKKLKSLDLMKYDIISFATHTLPAKKNINNSQPGLVLSLPEQSTVVDDGILTPGEIASLNLNAKIVILSACNTAVGKYENSESLSGLAESFIFAGAESLILSHWPVETEATSQLMQLFVNNLKTKKMPRAVAFQQAIIELKKTEQFTHPLFWAGFSYYGT
jgi:CHAT domain-containing protein